MHCVPSSCCSQLNLFQQTSAKTNADSEEYVELGKSQMWAVSKTEKMFFKHLIRSGVLILWLRIQDCITVASFFFISVWIKEFGGLVLVCFKVLPPTPVLTWSTTSTFYKDTHTTSAHSSLLVTAVQMQAFWLGHCSAYFRGTKLIGYSFYHCRLMQKGESNLPQHLEGPEG